MHLRSLQYKIATGILGAVALLFTVYVIWDYQFHRRKFLSELQDSAASLSAVISGGLIKVEMAGRHPEILQGSIEEFGTIPSIDGIYLLDMAGSVRFSSKRAAIGRTYGISEEGCRDCHLNRGKKPSSIFIEKAGSLILRNVVDIPNQPQCQGCHSAASRLLGLLIVDLEAGRVRNRLRADLNSMLIKAGMTICGILAALGLLLSRLVIRRLKRLTADAETLLEAREQGAPRAQEGSDEIGQLGAAFNRMVTRLERYRRDVREKEEMRALLLEKIVQIQEEERKRISRELHDHVGQSLSALLLLIQGNECIAQDESRTRSEFENRILGLIDEVHHLAWEMRPSILDDYGLDSALQTYAEDTAKHCGIPIDYQCNFPAQMARIPAWIEVILYRVAQEAITNLVRHSQASRASVVLLSQANNVILLIEDDGIGFELSFPQNDRKGLGLIGMKERVNLCGGSCLIMSTLSRGTIVRVTIPMVKVVPDEDSNIDCR
jgi:signal transduction histidine kinase